MPPRVPWVYATRGDSARSREFVTVTALQVSIKTSNVCTPSCFLLHAPIHRARPVGYSRDALSSIATMNPHYVPGMGYKKHNPGSHHAHTPTHDVACRTKCGTVELKITLTPKFLVRKLRDALVEPFLKVHNKRAAEPVAWEQIRCIKVDGYTVDPAIVFAEGEDAPNAGSILGTKELVSVLLLTELPSSLLEGVMEVAHEYEEVTEYNYMNRPPPPLTSKLIAVAKQAGADALSDHAEDVTDNDGASMVSNMDAESTRRCANAWAAVCGGADAVSAAKVRTTLLSDDHVRSLCFPPNTPHVPSIDNAVRRLAVDRGSDLTVTEREFTALFSALSAMACSPASFAQEDLKPGATGRKKKDDAGGFLQQLLDDDRVTSRRIA